MVTRTRRASEKFLTGAQFRIYRQSRHLSQTELAAWFGLTKQAIQRYERLGVTRSVALALSAIDRGLRPYQPTEDDYASIQQQKEPASEHSE